MNKSITIILCPVGQKAHTTTILNDLASMQKLVSGYIEAVTLPNGLILICNEEGLIRDLPPNRNMNAFRLKIVGNFRIAGDFFVCTADRAGEFQSVPDALIPDLIDKLNSPDVML